MLYNILDAAPSTSIPPMYIYSAVKKEFECG
jgi:hypothetical protein